MTSTYQDQKMAHALEAIDKKGNIVLQKKGEDALLFMPGAVAEFCIAHGYDENTASWSHGSYFSNLTAASMEFSPVIDVGEIHQEKSIETMLSPITLAQNELRDALVGDEVSFLVLLKEYGKDCALDYFDLYESIEQVAVEEEWSYERQKVQTEGLDRNADLYRFDPLGFLEATSINEVIDEAMQEFDGFCDWVAGADLEYVDAYGKVSEDIKHAMEKYQDALGKGSSERGLDEILEQANDTAEISETNSVEGRDIDPFDKEK